MSKKNVSKKKSVKKAPKVKGGVAPPKLFKKGVLYKHAMELLDKTIEASKQPKLYMDTRSEHPATRFLIALYDRIGHWNDVMMREFIEALTDTPVPESRSEKIVLVGKLAKEAFEYGESPEPYLARWKMWPHQRSSTQDGEDDMSKKATTTKEGAKGKNVPPKRKSTVSERAKLKPVDTEKKPKIEKRREVLAAVSKAGITAEALMKKTGCSMKTIEALIKKGFIDIVG